MLPGTNRAADRFARASFYVNTIPKSEDLVEAIASMFSVIRNVSVPYGISTPNEPNTGAPFPIKSASCTSLSPRWRRISFGPI